MNDKIKNIIERIRIHEWTGEESVGMIIIRIIYEILRPNISNVVVLWDKSNDNQIIENEFYPIYFNYTDFFEDNITQINECIYPIKGKDATIEYIQYLKPKISSLQSICVIPMFNVFSNRKGIIILLSSLNDIPLSTEQVKLLKNIIDESLALSIDITLKDVYKFIEQLSDFTYTQRKNKSLLNKYEILSKALKIHKNNIRHFSIWKVDSIRKEDKFKVIEEKSQNFQPENIAQTYLLDEKDNDYKIVRYIKDFIVEYKNDERNKKQERFENQVKKYIKISKFTKDDINQEKSCFTEKYCKAVGIEPDKTGIIYIPIIPLRLDEKKDIINILCLYINNLQYTIFDNLDILSMLSRKLYESLTLHNQLIRNDTTKEILKIQDRGENAENFYLEAAKILRKKTKCRGCYIYMKEKTDDLRMIVGIEKERVDNAKYINEDGIMVIEKRGLSKIDVPLPDNAKLSLPLQKKFLNDEMFLNFLKNAIYIEFSSSEKIYHLYYGNYPQEETNKVYSAILIPIRKQNKENKEEKKNETNFIGFLLFTDKNVRKDNGKEKPEEKFSPYFSAHNESIVSPSVESIYRYKLLQDSFKDKGMLLDKIRHEIPHDVNLINQQAKEIKGYFELRYEEANDKNSNSFIQYIKENNISKKTREDEKEKQKEIKVTIEKKYISDIEYYSHKRSVTNQLLFSNMRIDLFASFATSVNFTNDEILSKRKTLNFKTYINSVKEIFRQEAMYNGCKIIFDENKNDYRIENVSKFYELAIHNIILNAIRYSRFGTCIEVNMRPGIIEVINWGIGIDEKDEKKIYEENYRGEEAIKFTEIGLGYGLYLAKRVIHAHVGHELTHISKEKYKYNYAGISNFCDFLRSSGLESINRFIKDERFKISNKKYKDFLSEMDVLLSQTDYHLLDKVFVSNFVESEFGYKQIDFDTFQSRYLKCNVYKTIFTIKFP